MYTLKQTTINCKRRRKHQLTAKNSQQ